MPSRIDEATEWLEADGLGGFASGTTSGIRTRRYHGLLLVAKKPPTDRIMLVNGVEASVEIGGRSFALTSQRYAPDVVHPDGVRRIESFDVDPWPRWRYRLEDGTAVDHQIFVPKDAPIVVLSWRVHEAAANLTLAVRPLLSGRDYHSLQRENPAFAFEPERASHHLVWQPYDGVPAIVAITNGRYEHRPDWYRNFEYAEERTRGLDHVEDLASPGVFRFDLSTRREAVLSFAADAVFPDAGAPEALRATLAAGEESRRKSFRSRLHRSADAYVVRRGSGNTIVAGYPWFTDWGRDTFISLRGLAIATGRLDDARSILLEWSESVSEGMLPNRFPDRGESPEFNSADASLWYVIAADEYLRAVASRTGDTPDTERLLGAIDAILEGYSRGTRFAIRADSDGLLAAGAPGVQLTWMDAKIGDWVVTPRIGKPVELQALWLNALWIGSRVSERWRALFQRGWESFARRFWCNDGHLYDVVDVDHRPGTADATFRPNQIFAVGGLPLAIVDGERARKIVDAIEERLWTPIGLRSLAPGEPAYVARYRGAPRERDGAYHQGIVWPWLLGPFVQAWVRVRGRTPEAKAEARRRFLVPLFEHLDDAGLGHVSEIADAEPPYTPRGCPFQAWSLGELLRLDLEILA